MGKHAIVIGAGFGGLATANLLAKDGYSVTVYESRSQLGGRAGSFKANGFTFDTGPSWYLMPEVFEHYFSLLDRKVSDYIELERLTPAYRVFDETASGSVDIFADLEKDMQTFESIEPGSAAKLKMYVDNATQVYEASIKLFLYQNFDRLKWIINRSLWSSLKSLPRSLSLHNHVKSYFKNPRLQKILEYPMVFLGASPYRAPSIYSLMSHLDFNQGVFYPKGGIYTVVEAMVKIGEELGVVYMLNARVEEILVNNSDAYGVKIGDEVIVADLIISNADLHTTDTMLLKAPSNPRDDKWWSKTVTAPSAILLYLGIRGNIDTLVHHNLIFVKDWKQNFSDIYDDKRWPDQASMYVCAPSKTDPSVAPPGHENLFVLIPLPSNYDLSTEEQSDRVDRYITQLAQAIGVDNFRDRIVYQKYYGPNDFAADYSSWQSSALGLSHTWMQSAFFRPSIKVSQVANLYNVGANVRPGIGLPMCLISAQLIRKSLKGDHSVGPELTKGAR